MRYQFGDLEEFEVVTRLAVSDVRALAGFLHDRAAWTDKIRHHLEYAGLSGEEAIQHAARAGVLFAAIEDRVREIEGLVKSLGRQAKASRAAEQEAEARRRHGRASGPMLGI